MSLLAESSRPTTKHAEGNYTQWRPLRESPYYNNVYIRLVDNEGRVKFATNLVGVYFFNPDTTITTFAGVRDIRNTPQSSTTNLYSLADNRPVATQIYIYRKNVLLQTVDLTLIDPNYTFSGFPLDYYSISPNGKYIAVTIGDAGILPPNEKVLVFVGE